MVRRVIKICCQDDGIHVTFLRTGDFLRTQTYHIHWPARTIRYLYASHRSLNDNKIDNLLFWSLRNHRIKCIKTQYCPPDMTGSSSAYLIDNVMQRLCLFFKTNHSACPSVTGKPVLGQHDKTFIYMRQLFNGRLFPVWYLRNKCLKNYFFHRIVKLHWNPRSFKIL